MRVDLISLGVDRQAEPDDALYGDRGIACGESLLLPQRRPADGTSGRFILSKRNMSWRAKGRLVSCARRTSQSGDVAEEHAQEPADRCVGPGADTEGGGTAVEAQLIE